MALFEAPAKVNLSLMVDGLDSSGLHRIDSVAQTVEWSDLLEVEEADADTLLVEGADLTGDEDNLVLKAVARARLETEVAPARFVLTKEIPVAAGLGGGSSDAAAALLACLDLSRLTVDDLRRIAPTIGSDVPMMLLGGTVRMSGTGEVLDQLLPLESFAVAIAVPPFELVTADVYRRWDQLDGPQSASIGNGSLPPSLRHLSPLRNDLTPAAVDIRPDLGDFMADVSRLWGRPVAMSGSGPSCFGFFADEDEASAAAAAVKGITRSWRGAALRRLGAVKVER